MISDETIQGNIALFKGLEAHLTQLVGKYKSLEEDAGKLPNEILRKWYNLCNENYAISRRRVSDYLSGQTIAENNLNDFQYMRQVGTVLMPIILNFVNSYEYISTLLRLNSKSKIVKSGSDVYTDGWKSYDALAVYGYNHKKVKHDENEFAREDGSHINGIESFWS